MSATMSDVSAYAPAPFDHAKADIILRSSDDVDFRVFKLFLSLASPIFESLFDTSQVNKDQKIKDGLVVIPMSEDSKTLDTLLSFCYPCTLVDDPHLEVFEDLLKVLEAAQKYSLDVVERKICCTLSNPKILEAEPLRCFAIAHRAQLREETLLAARYTLTQPLIPVWFQEIYLITAADLLALLTYHRECGDAVYALRTDMSWVTSHYGSSQACKWLSGKRGVPEPAGEYTDSYYHRKRPTNTSKDDHDCQCPRFPTSKYDLFGSDSLRWWEDFMAGTFEALRDKPCKATVESFAEKTKQSVRTSGCETCSAYISEGMRDFTELLVEKLDEVVSKIQLDFNPQDKNRGWKGKSKKAK